MTRIDMKSLKINSMNISRKNMTIIKIQSTKKNEKGIALLFTLIMLSLLLILAMSFALDSMFSQKAAYNSAGSSSAELMSQSQLQEILCLVQNDSANFSKATYSRDIYGTTGVAADDMLRELIKVRGLLDDNNNTTALDNVKWNYIKNISDNNRISGRAAFVIIPDEKIPLPSLVDGRVSEADYPKHDEKDDTETRIGKYVSEINVRYAIPNFNASKPGDVQTISDALNYATDTPVSGAGFSNGKFTGTWDSFDSFFGVLETAISRSLTSGEKDEIQSNLTINTSTEEEAFWMDTNGDDKIDDGELFRRFDLTRTDWDKSTHAEDLVFLREQILMLNGGDTSTIPTLAMQDWKDTDGTAITSGLPWLAFFGYLADGNDSSLFKGSFDNVANRRAQIAANLKDYCDRDKDDITSDGSTELTDAYGDPVIRPTSDKDPTTWLTNEPAFTGNEETPYIDKVGMEINIIRSDSTSGSLEYAEITVDVKPWVGLVNIYNSTSPTNNLKVQIKGSVTCTANKGQSDAVTIKVPIEQYINLSGWTATAQSYSHFAPGNFKDETGSILWDSSDLTVSIDSVIIEKVILFKGNSGGNYVAYDYTKQLVQGNEISDAFVGGDGDDSTSWYGWAVHDPRQNLNQSDWKLMTGQKDITDPSAILSLFWDGSKYLGRPNCQNSSFGGTDSSYNTENPQDRDPTSTSSALYGDKESSADPAKLSTNFIRNAPMQSPWELGFIHRAQRWQTINLKQYYKDKAYKPMSGKSYLAGGDVYYNGDANILDQIKMTHDAQSPRKINLNSTASATFKALIAKVKYGCDIGDMSVSAMAGISPVTGTELTPGNADTDKIAANIKDKYDPIKGVAAKERQTRASVVDKLKLPMTDPVISADNDAKQEELVGKIVNLTRIGSQTGHFTIIVVAQSIKDIGGPGTAEIKVYKVPYDGSTAKEVTCKTGTFDITTGTDNTTWKDDAYGDDVVATKKIIFKGRVIGAGKIKVLGIQYND